MARCIVTYAAGAHEELLDISLPTYKAFAQRHRYEVIVGAKLTDLPPAWNKVLLLLEALTRFDEVVWFDCDLVVVDPSLDFPKLKTTHSLVRHFEDDSEVPNSGVWRLRPTARPLLEAILQLQVFRDHGWWEQAALMTLMGYSVPPQGSDFRETKCRCVQRTRWTEECSFMRVQWNSHPNYRAERPRIVHCSYPNMLQRVETMRALVRDPAYDYPRYDKEESNGVQDVRGADTAGEARSASSN